MLAALVAVAVGLLVLTPPCPAVDAAPTASSFCLRDADSDGVCDAAQGCWDAPAEVGRVVADSAALDGGDTGVAVSPDGAYAFAAGFDSNSLAVIDVHSDPRHPAVVGSVAGHASLNGPRGVAVSPDGRFVYVVGYNSDSVAVVNVTDPLNPAVVGSIVGDSTHLDGAYDVAVFLPPNASIGSDDDNDKSQLFVVVSGHQSASVVVVNVTEPTVPRVVGSIIGDTVHFSSACGVSVSPDGQYALVASYLSNSLTVVDVGTDPTVPVVVGTVTDSANLNGAQRVVVAPGGQFVFVVGYLSATLAVVDYGSDPSAPAVVGTSGTAGHYLAGVAVSPGGRFVFVVGLYGNELVVLDVAADPANPVVVGTIADVSEDATLTVAVAPNGEHVYMVVADVSSGNTSLAVVENGLSVLGSIVGDATNLNHALGVAMSPRGDLVFVAGYDSDSVAVVDVHSDPANPTVIGAIVGDATHLDGAHNVAVFPNGQYILVTGHLSDSLAVVDVGSDPASPTLVGSIVGASVHMNGPIGVAIAPSGSYAVVTSRNSQSVAVVNITDPTNPVVTGSIVGDSVNLDGAESVAFSRNGQHAFVTARNSNMLVVVDVGTDPTAPEIIGSTMNVTVMNDPIGVAASADGRYAFVAGYGSHSLAVVDIGSDPTSPEVIGSIVDSTSLGGAHGVTVSPNSGVVFVTGWGSSSVAAVDVGADPMHPTVLHAIVGDTSNFANPYAAAVSPNATLLVVPGAVSNSLAVIALACRSADADACVGDSLNDQDSDLICDSQDSCPGDAINDADSDSLCSESHGCWAEPVVAGSITGDVSHMHTAVGVAVSPDGQYAYVGGLVSDSLAIVDVLTDPTSPVVVGTIAGDFTRMDGAHGVAVSSDGQYVYVSGHYSDSIAVVDVSTPTGPVVVGSVVGDYRLNGANELVLSSDGHVAYVVGYAGSSLASVYVANPTSPQMAGAIVGDTTNMHSARSVAISPNDTLVYVASYDSDSLAVVNVSNYNHPVVVATLVDDINLNGPYSVRLSPDGQYAYVGCIGVMESITVVDVGTDPKHPAVVGRVVGAGRAVAVSPNGKFLFGMNFNTDSVTVFDVTDPPNPIVVSSIVDSVNINGPFAAATSPDGQYVYVVGYYGHSIAVLKNAQPCRLFDTCPYDSLNDKDSDGVCDGSDSCLDDTMNDADADGICFHVDSCPADSSNDADSDRICSDIDSCPNDALDDADSDLICGDVDSCPTDAANDADSDFLCFHDDSCPTDSENDADSDVLCAGVDSCPHDAENDGDSDSMCGPGDSCPTDPSNDADSDMLCHDADSCPTDPWNDYDSDQLCRDVDSCSEDALNDADGDDVCSHPCIEGFDADDDLICAEVDSCPFDRANDPDDDLICQDVDSCRRDAENDADSDTVCGDADRCRYDAENDKDSDGMCSDVDTCANDDENDADSDRVCGDVDSCPNDAVGDADSDFLCTATDSCPNDSDNDSDSDEICGNVDSCADDAANDADSDALCAGVDSCPFDGQDDTDSDSLCADQDSCAFDADNDADSDFICGDVDSCPLGDLDDADSDGLCESSDSCPADAQNDADSDMICGNLDTCEWDMDNDADSDEVCRDMDSCPADSENDADSDDTCGHADPCPHDAHDDVDSDGICGDVDSCLADSENDADSDNVCGDVDCPRGCWYNGQPFSCDQLRLHSGMSCFEIELCAQLDSCETITGDFCQCDGCATCSGSPPECPVNSTGNVQTWFDQFTVAGIGGTLDLCDCGFCAGGTDVEWLLWDDTNTTGTIPALLCSLSSLQMLSGNNNLLSGTIPECVASLQSLTMLRLGNNSLSGSLAASWGANTSFARNRRGRELGDGATSLGNLVHLDIGSNQLSGTLPASWSKLTGLTTLGVHRNQVSGTVPSSFGSLHKLRTLALGANALTGTLPPSIASCTALGWAYLQSNSFSGPLTAVDWTKAAATMTFLSMGANQFSGTLPNEWGSLNSHKMQTIYVGDNLLHGTIPASWGSLRELTQLAVQNSFLSGTLPASWASLTKLQRLGVFENQLSGALPPAWAGMSSLIALGLHENRFSGTVPSVWGSFEKMRDFDLRSNTLNGTIPASLNGLSLVEFFDLASNRFTGSLPNLARLQAVTYFNVGYNHLTGMIPPFATTLEDLTVFDVGGNQLTGTMPDLTNSTALKILILSRNTFTGTLSLPHASSIAGIYAFSNNFSSLNHSSWCDTTAALACDLSNMFNAAIGCQLHCDNDQGAFTLDLASQCGLKCPCAEMTGSSFNASDPAHVHVDRTSCGATHHSGTCVFGCEPGFVPGILAQGQQQPQLPWSDDPNPQHIATCLDGEWTFTDEDTGLVHGCVEQGCRAVADSDLEFVAVGTCTHQVAAGTTCQVECSTGTTLTGSSIITCSRGQWDTGDTRCIPPYALASMFTCKALTNDLIPNVNTSSCRGTEGRQNIGFAEDDPSVYNFQRDVLSLEGSCVESHIQGCNRHPPGECTYECAAGYFANPAAPTVYCDLTKWDIGSASCTARSCDDFWSDWSNCSGFCEDGENPGQEYRTFRFTDREYYDAVAAIATNAVDENGTSSCPQLDNPLDIVSGAFVEHRHCHSRPRCCRTAEAYASGSCNVTTAAAGGLGFGLLSCDALWTDWDRCNRFCFDGNQSRVFAATAWINKTNGTVTWALVQEYIAMECHNALGDVQTESCEYVAERNFPQGGYLECDKYDCHEFYTDWTNCSQYCANGNQSRQYIVPTDDAERQSFDLEVCQRPDDSGHVKFPESGVVQTLACEDAEPLGGGYTGGNDIGRLNLSCGCPFWSDWSSCDALCRGGTQWRTFFVEPEYQDYAVEVCSDQLAHDWETRDCPPESYDPKTCDKDLCELFWTNWTLCTEICDGGEQTRYFNVSAAVSAAGGDPTLLQFNLEVCQSEEDGLRYPPDTGNETLPCAVVGEEFPDDRNAGHPRCAAELARRAMVAAVVMSIVAVLAIAAVAAWLRWKWVQEKKALESTATGRLCVRATRPSLKRAAQLLHAINSLGREYSDQNLNTIWFALDRGRRHPKKARELLRLATTAQLKQGRTLIEALEQAEWAVEHAWLPPLHRMLLDKVPNLQAMREELKIVTDQLTLPSGAEEEAMVAAAWASLPPYLHIAVSAPWPNVDRQREVVELLAAVPALLSRTYRSRPYARNVPSQNPLQRALERHCAPQVVAALLQADAGLAATCSFEAVETLCSKYPNKVATVIAPFLESGLWARLQARLRTQCWKDAVRDKRKQSMDAGSRSRSQEITFVPPCVKAHELQLLLGEVAEKKLAFAPAGMGERASVSMDAPTRQSQRQMLFDLKGSDDEDSDDDDAQNDASATAVPKQVGGQSHVKGQASAVAHHNKNAVVPLAALRNVNDSGRTGGIGSEAEDKPATPDTETGALSSVLGACEVVSPWSSVFRVGFVRPVLAVLRRFLADEISAAATGGVMIDAFQRESNVLMQGFKSIYDAIAERFVMSDPERPKFVQLVRAIEPQPSCRRGPNRSGNTIAKAPNDRGESGRGALQTEKLRQATSDLEELYLACHRVLPQFHEFMQQVICESNALDGSGPAKLKSMYRAMEKIAFRDDGRQWSADNVLDIVRGGLIFSDMQGLQAGLEAVKGYKGLTIRRVKDRFTNPTSGGWRDCSECVSLLAKCHFLGGCSMFFCARICSNGRAVPTNIE